MRRLLTASRPFSWINTCLPFLATAIAAGHQDLAAVVLGAAYFLVPYNLLMYGLNDLYDYESDRDNPRKGGVEGAVLEPSAGRRLWLLVGATNLPFLIAAYPVAGVVPGLALTLAAVVAAIYSVPPIRTKVVPGLDSLTSSLHFTLPAVCGALLAGSAPAALPWRILAALLLWGIASHALGAIQDVDVDRAAGLGSIATVIGGRATGLLSTAFYLAAAVLVAAGGGPALIAATALIPYVLVAVSCLGGDAVQARRAWTSFMGQNLLSGFLITQLLLHLWGLGPRDPLVLLAWSSGAGAWAWTLLAIAGQLALRRRAPSASRLPALTVAGEAGERPLSTYPGPVEVRSPLAGRRPTTEGAVIALVDAGTDLAPGALRVLVEELGDQGGGMVALLPRQAGGTAGERSLSLLSTSLAPVPRFGAPLALRFGASGCAAVDARSHRLAGGGAEIADLAGRIAGRGAPVRLRRGADLATFSSPRGEVARRLRDGYYLDWCRASMPIALTGLLLPPAILLMPVALVVAATATGDVPALAGAIWGCAAIVLLRSVTARLERQPWTDLLWHPVSIAWVAGQQALSVAAGLSPRRTGVAAASPEPAR